METAHLTKAHEHARNAATATYSNSIVTAGAEHELAASAFRDAAQDAHNDEALRILALLEDHHLKLASLIKEPPRATEPSKDTTSSIPEHADTHSSTGPAKLSSSRSLSPSNTRAPPRRRLPQSSIASNLAEKRGIPGARRSTPSASSVSVTNALATRNEQTSPSVRDMLQQQQSRKSESNKSKEDEPNEPAKSKAPPLRRDVSPPPDDNFRRFYSAFGGVISAISAPLAFTSLPLNPLSSSLYGKEDPPATQTPLQPANKSKPTTKKSDQHHSLEASRTIKSSEPDLAALISKPALRALREDQSAPLGPFANNESFYFVPTSGGTVSYANILRDPQAHPHHAAQDPHLDSIAEGDNEGGSSSAGALGLRGSSHEEFVDARENVGPPSPTTPRRPRSSKGPSSTTTPSGGGVTTAQTIRAGRGQGLKTLEELHLENETLRALIDKQSKRLSMWETTSQSSYNALAQSFRARGGGGPTLKPTLSDPSALAQALSMGSNALPSPPPVPNIPPQYHQPGGTPKDTTTQTSTPSTANETETDDAKKRIADLESLLATHAAQISSLTADNQRLSRDKERNAQVISRYREQWEKLKAGARKKEQERRERRVTELRAGEGQQQGGNGRDSESGGTTTGDAEGEGEDEIGDAGEEGFGKA
ncbi:hypothetical protein BU24DRAFT_491709 [Aaosphaeria arxii CBS 175.79]|uniref:Uncharacterized protein n=1 Tax=Aaosphaeria arxii CBS 175.79 TaxID=1450172 RepID=A0A6A5XRE0_9PLEO|nr:uncharacterized protein BU24DRAFT_491709 [Aaosphaeria arxii CBS 175.79]KAF2015469.1 hypothetical protein BU24DRAFT_491709 [Aaosphaeria arxii CBS 175.79]